MTKNTIRCVLLDDETLALQYLKMLCEQIPDLEIVKVFDQPQLFMSELPSLDFDLCIMDIEMPAMNGLQVANLLQDKAVIFTTAYSDYAIDAFEVNAIDYIKKPVKHARLQQAIDKVHKMYKKDSLPNDYLSVNTDKGKGRLSFDKIAYFTVSEVDSRDKIVYLIDGTSMIIKNISFQKLEELLPKNQFCRINKKELIALQIVNFYTHDEIESNVVWNSKMKTFSIGNNYREDFMNML